MMKTFAIFLVLVFVWQPSNAGCIWKTCLGQNGLGQEQSNVEIMFSIEYPDPEGKHKNLSQEQIANVMACAFQRKFGDLNLYSILKELVVIYELKEEDAKKATELLNKCNENAPGDNAKLLNCANLLAPPISDLVSEIRDLPRHVHPCFLPCNMTIPELAKVMVYREDWKKIEGVPEEKLLCAFSCKLDDDRVDDPEKPTVPQSITKLINKSEALDENQKKDMLDTLKTCSDKAVHLPDQNLELAKCLNVLKPPFVNIF